MSTRPSRAPRSRSASDRACEGARHDSETSFASAASPLTAMVCRACARARTDAPAGAKLTEAGRSSTCQPAPSKKLPNQRNTVDLQQRAITTTHHLERRLPQEARLLAAGCLLYASDGLTQR